MAMRYFLLVFDRAAGRLVDEVKEFDSSADALGARFEREQAERGNASIEVVVLGAENRRALEATHARYFGAAGELAAS